MISFYKDEASVVMYKDDTYLTTDMFVIERPATEEDVATHSEEHAAFVASITLTPEPDATAPANPNGGM
jgi:hypothetical protein